MASARSFDLPRGRVRPRRIEGDARPLAPTSRPFPQGSEGSAVHRYRDRRIRFRWSRMALSLLARGAGASEMAEAEESRADYRVQRLLIR